MSAVYRAYDTLMGREVALKRLLPIEETWLNEAAEESLAREAAALARLQHPNIVTVYAFEEDAEGPFVVMELVEGGDLRSVMKEGPLAWEEFREIALQCLDPLVAAGEMNLLHRDIKPANLMVSRTPSGRRLVKLLDFGLAKFSARPSVQTLDQKGSFLGSIDYIAPEQLELMPLDQRTDLYSLGCVFYFMLAQKAPFSGGSPAETSMNHLNHRCRPIAELRPDLPPLVGGWLMRMISRDPEDRPENAKEALRQFLDAEKGIAYQDPMLGDIPDDPFADLPDMEGVAEPEDISVAVAMAAGRGVAGKEETESRPKAAKRLIVPAVARWPRHTAQPRQEMDDWLRRVRAHVKRWHLWTAAAVLVGLAALAVHLATRQRNVEIQPVAAMGDVQTGAG
ncbi:MAG TPA: serine/threonine-protein kinase, partial [Bacteroidia bacterium]|nr:serine/threonine-protein kinase [Bacteroidia bacterium]